MNNKTLLVWGVVVAISSVSLHGMDAFALGGPLAYGCAEAARLEPEGAATEGLFYLSDLCFKGAFGECAAIDWRWVRTLSKAARKKLYALLGGKASQPSSQAVSEE